MSFKIISIIILLLFFVILLGVSMFWVCKRVEKFGEKKYLSFTDKIKRRMKSPEWDSDKYVKYVDKLLFKEYAKSKGVKTQKTLAIFENSGQIDLNKINPNCVIKVNNGSGRNIIIKNYKIIVGPFKGHNIHNKWKEVSKQLEEWRKPFNPTGEPWYKYIKPKIFIEELMDPVPPDYKFFVFDGKVKIIQVDNDRFKDHCSKYYNINWEDTGCKYVNKKCNFNISKPENLKEMIVIAEKLSDKFDFVRVDLYNYQSNIFAGEMTFAPYAGVVQIPDDKCDKMFSGWWDEKSSKNLATKFTTLNEKYGGYKKNIECPYSSGKGKNAQCQGGDKFGGYHNYQDTYAKEFLPYLDKNTNLLEVGILEGKSLAVWSDIFHKGHIIGFDIQLESFNKNIGNLKKLGAFRNNNYSIFKTDTTKKESQFQISRFLNNKKLDIIIDDGCHTDDCILNTFATLLPHLKQDGVYIIEDNKNVHKKLRKLYPDLSMSNIGELTIVKQR